MRHSTHHWRYLSRKHSIASVLVLVHARTAREIDDVTRVEVGAQGTLAECAQCGVLAFWGHRTDEAGERHDLALFGVDLDAMTPTRTPRCEALSREVEAA